VPIRKVSNRGGNIIGAFPSIKNNKTVHYESTIERDFLFFLEYDQDVLSYELQPFVIEGKSEDGKHRSYTPDVLISRPTGKELVECKPASRLQDPHSQRQFALGQAWCDANDYDYIIITEKHLRTSPQLANLKLLWRYSRLNIPLAAIERIYLTLAPFPEGLPLFSLAQHLNSYFINSSPQSILYSLLFQHILITDLYQPLMPDSVIRLLFQGSQVYLPI
jgi:hypothetical protein